MREFLERMIAEQREQAERLAAMEARLEAMRVRAAALLASLRT